MNQAAPAAHPGYEVSLPYASASASAEATLHVRTLTGADELAFAEAQAERASPVALASLLIARCATADADQARAMALGDREVVLRALYAANFGARFAARLHCPAGCAEAIEFDVDLSGLTEPAPEPGLRHRLAIGDGIVECRVPTGADLEAALAGPGDPADALAAACTAGELNASELLSQKLSRLDPNAECALTLACPECAAPVEAVLDGLELIRDALGEGGGIMAQVDRLARAYGWTEAEILALPRSRRLRYCAMVQAGAAA